MIVYDIITSVFNWNVILLKTNLYSLISVEVNKVKLKFNTVRLYFDLAKVKE